MITQDIYTKMNNSIVKKGCSPRSVLKMENEIRKFLCINPLDLTSKFDRSAVLANVNPSLETVTVTGKLTDGRMFAG